MTFADLALRQRQDCITHVERCMATLRTDATEDVVRFAIDAYCDSVGDELVLTAFDDGVNAALDGKYQKAAG